MEIDRCEVDTCAVLSEFEIESKIYKKGNLLEGKRDSPK